MPSFEHKMLVQQIGSLDSPPSNQNEFAEWVKAATHLAFLKTNARTDELVTYGSGEFSFIHAMAVPEDSLESTDRDDLLAWSCDPYRSAASYVSGGDREGMRVEYGSFGLGSKIIDNGTQLVFGRSFYGWSGDDRDYFEILQEFAHLEGLHWRPEHRSYCRFDSQGDLEQAISVTVHGEQNVSLVSFKWAPLETYLAASGQVLVRLFDFTLCDRANFSGWPRGPETLVEESEDFFYRQKVAGPAAYTRGVQIIRPSRPNDELFSVKQGSSDDQKQYAEFIAHDWRNNCVTKISTSPGATTNYFQAEHNKLPFELSPAFFRPEVLLKYKTDRDKYKIGERDIQCRAAWHLRGFDMNEAGQVHAYICYLRALPYTEQLHWQSYNEAPKAPISKRAVQTDFEGRFSTFVEPLGRVKSKVRQWNDAPRSWWRPRDQQTMDRVSVPYTSSRDEWAESFMDLTKLIHEGFVVKPIRTKLRERGVAFNSQEQSLALLEKLINDVSEPEEPVRLAGLRMAQFIRTKTKGHTSGREAQELAQSALQEHETYTNHFRHVCEQVHDELVRIEETFSLL